MPPKAKPWLQRTPEQLRAMTREQLIAYVTQLQAQIEHKESIIKTLSDELRKSKEIPY